MENNSMGRVINRLLDRIEELEYEVQCTKDHPVAVPEPRIVEVPVFLVEFEDEDKKPEYIRWDKQSNDYECSEFKFCPFSGPDISCDRCPYYE